MSALTFSHLRSFCYSIEQDSQKLRKLSESKVSVEGDLEDATSFVKELRSEVSDVENETKLLEKYIFNRTEEKKVPYICADEIVSRCELLLENNKSSMTMLKKHLQKYDHKCVSESTNTVSSSKGNLSNNNQNKENNENNNDNQLPPVVDAEQSNSCMNMDVDVDTIDLHSQHHEAADDHNIQSAFLFEQNSQLKFQIFDSVPDFLFDQGKIESNTNTNINTNTNPNITLLFTHPKTFPNFIQNL